jgi:hypothetical protein
MFFLFIISTDLLIIYLLDAGARKREQRRQLYAASKDAINARRREIYAQKRPLRRQLFKLTMDLCCLNMRIY